MTLVFSYEWLALFEALDSAARKRVLAKLKEIERADAWPHEALKGKQFRRLFKLRVGDYRLIYRIQDDGVLDFLTLGHRREVYE